MGASLEVGMDTVDGVSHRDSFVGRFFFGFWDKKGERRGPRGFGALGLGCRTGLMYAELFGIEWEVYNYKERGVAVKRKPCGNSAC